MIRGIVYLSLIFLACSPGGKEDRRLSEEKGLRAESIDYTAEGVTLKGYLAYDPKIEGKRPGVLVVHEWWGHNEHARKRARMLAELGYTALAVDMYGEGRQASHPDDAGKFATEIMQHIGTGEARFLAALDLLKQHPTTDPDRIAAIGYCFGGAVVLHMARIGTDLDGVVSFHGNLSSLHRPAPGSVKAKVLVCHGADDSLIPPEQVESFKGEMEEAGVDYRFISYPGARHSFTNPDADRYAVEFGLPLAYNPEADARSWKDMQEFLAGIFKE